MRRALECGIDLGAAGGLLVDFQACPPPRAIRVAQVSFLNQLVRKLWRAVRCWRGEHREARNAQ